MAKDQLKLWLDTEIIASVQQAAERFSKRSANEVAAEVLSRYLSFWVETEEAKAAVFEQQREQLEASVYMKGRGTRGEVERVIKDAQAREKKKGNR